MNERMNEWAGGMLVIDFFLTLSHPSPTPTLGPPDERARYVTVVMSLYWLIASDSVHSIALLTQLRPRGARQFQRIASSAGGSHVMYPWWIRVLVSVHRTEEALMDNGRNHRRKGKDWFGRRGGVISRVPDVWRVMACEGHYRGQEAPYVPLLKLKHLILCLSGFVRVQLTKSCPETRASTPNKFHAA